MITAIILLILAVVTLGSLLHLLQAVVPLVLILVAVAIISRVVWRRV